MSDFVIKSGKSNLGYLTGSKILRKKISITFKAGFHILRDIKRKRRQRKQAYLYNTDLFKTTRGGIKTSITKNT